MKKYMKWIGALAAFCLLCFSVTVITRSSETLADYAERQPEAAYAGHTPQADAAAAQQAADQTATGKADAQQAADQAEADTQQTAAQAAAGKADAPAQSEPADAQAAGTGGKQMSEHKNETHSIDRMIYQPDFYYEPLSADIRKRITGLSYKEDCPVPYEDLCYVSVLYVNFKGNTSTGEIICNKAIAQDLTEIFYELYQADYQIEQIRLVDEYAADDALSMQDNNTSCFNYRTIAGTDNISMHGQGLAIDINPFFNPYVTYHDGGIQVAPTGAESYVDRDKPFAYKIDENDLCYKLFTEHGFTWGGHWNSCKDYQHFEKKIR